MIDDYEYLEKQSRYFKEHIIKNQMKLNEIRASQFQNMLGDVQKVDLDKIREERKKFQMKENAQLKILMDEMNNIMVVKIRKFEGKSFKIKEMVQEKILLDGLKKERTGMLKNTLATFSGEFDSLLMPLIVHVDMLLENKKLSEKQRNHLERVRNNVLCGSDIF